MVPEDEKFALVDRLIARVSFPGAQANTVDGLRVDFADGWALVRASNTTPCLTVRFEAKDQATLDRIAGQMRQELLAVDATLTLPF
jgi:phosphomannomutase